MSSQAAGRLDARTTGICITLCTGKKRMALAPEHLAPRQDIILLPYAHPSWLTVMLVKVSSSRLPLKWIENAESCVPRIIHPQKEVFEDVWFGRLPPCAKTTGAGQQRGTRSRAVVCDDFSLQPRCCGATDSAGGGPPPNAQDNPQQASEQCAHVFNPGGHYVFNPGGHCRSKPASGAKYFWSEGRGEADEC